MEIRRSNILTKDETMKGESEWFSLPVQQCQIAVRVSQLVLA